MLPIPTTTTELGYADDNETTVYTDWVECSALFHNDPISKADVKECFSEIYPFDAEKKPLIVEDIWAEIERRKKLLGRCYPISIKKNRITTSEWREYAAYSFCALLSYSKSNREWERNSCNDYLVQGELFEQLSAAVLACIFKNWVVMPIGWSKDSSANIKTRIQSIAMELGEQPTTINPRPVDKDGGVDIMCYKKFTDKRGNSPVFFIQCATGRNWTKKRMENALNLWRNWIHFKSPDLLSRGLSVPFAFGNSTFQETQIRGNSLVLDRIRLFSHNMDESEWLPKDTFTDIHSWIQQKLDALSLD